MLRVHLKLPICYILFQYLREILCYKSAKITGLTLIDLMDISLPMLTLRVTIRKVPSSQNHSEAVLPPSLFT